MGRSVERDVARLRAIAPDVSVEAFDDIIQIGIPGIGASGAGFFLTRPERRGPHWIGRAKERIATARRIVDDLKRDAARKARPAAKKVPRRKAA